MNAPQYKGFTIAKNKNGQLKAVFDMVEGYNTISCSNGHGGIYQAKFKKPLTQVWGAKTIEAALHLGYKLHKDDRALLKKAEKRLTNRRFDEKICDFLRQKNKNL